MDVSSIFEPLGPAGVWPRIWAYMLWPSDEDRRQAFVASAYVHAFAAIEEIPNEASDLLGQESFEFARELIGCDLLGDFCMRAGGWSALSPALNIGIDAPKKVAALGTAAWVLDIIRSIPGGGTFNKAAHVIERTAERYAIKARGRTQIKAAWRNYKTVAHLGVALRGILGDPEPDESAELQKFLATARDYQRFGTRYRVPGQRGPLVDPAHGWMVPDNLSLPIPPPQRPLPEDMLAALIEYRAPQ